MAKNTPNDLNGQSNGTSDKSDQLEVVHDADAAPDTKHTGVQESYEWLEPKEPNLIDGIVAPEFKPPFYARYRVLTILAILATIGWLAASASFVFENLGLADIAQLLPHELGGMAAGIATPIALIWIVVAFFEKTKIYQAESRALRWHLQQLTYPADSAETRVAEISEALRAQTQALRQAMHQI